MKNTALLVLFVVVVGVLPWTMRSSSLLGFLVLVGIYAIVAMGVDLVFGYAGQITMANGAFFAIGAYSSGILTLRHGVPPLLALVIGMIVAAIIAYLIGAPLLGMLTHFHLAMATLAFGLLVYNFLVVGGEFTGGFSGLPGVPRFSIGPYTIADQMSYYYLTWVFVIILLIIGLNVGHSQVGRILKAIRTDEIAASAVGINVRAYKLNIFVLSAIFSSVGGSLLAHYSMFVAPTTFDITTSFDLITMSVLGGRGTIIGGVFGATFLKLLPQMTDFFRNYRLLSNGILITLVLLFFPGGISGALNLALRQAGKIIGSRAPRPPSGALAQPSQLPVNLGEKT